MPLKFMCGLYKMKLLRLIVWIMSKLNEETPKQDNFDDDKTCELFFYQHFIFWSANKTCEWTSKSEDDFKLKFGQEEGTN